LTRPYTNIKVAFIQIACFFSNARVIFDFDSVFWAHEYSPL
jgi:hypothetical protein